MLLPRLPRRRRRCQPRSPRSRSVGRQVTAQATRFCGRTRRAREGSGGRAARARAGAGESLRLAPAALATGQQGR
eukprot:364586-Chlamydomonas_euryale.AAC.10